MVFILGNGPTRKQFDITQFKDSPKRQVIYGCNAIYREPEAKMVNGIIAIDDGMIAEIKASAYREKLETIPEDMKWEPAECNPNRPRSNAGMVAMQIAIKNHPKARHLYCIGFDFLLVDLAKATGNIFDGTQNYGFETRCHPRDFPNRFRFLEYLMKKNPDVNFVFGFPKGSEIYMSEQKNYVPASFDTIYTMVESRIT